MQKALQHALAVMALLLAAGCDVTISGGDGLLNRLDGRGPVTLSPDNPYLVGNLALAREVDRSPVLKGFVAHRGTPSAIEVTHTLFTPYHMTLYYASANEQYSYEKSGEEWIIDGPAPILQQRVEISAASRSRAPAGGEANLLSGADLKSSMNGSNSRRSAEPAAEPTQVPFVAPLFSSPQPAEHAPNSAGFRSPDAIPPPPPAAAAAPAPRPMGDQDLVALFHSKSSHQAELSPRGDIVHYVTLPGETLALIARWYTLDRINAGRIARINNLKNSETVSVGDIIVVPAYLVKNKYRLTPEGLELLQKMSAQKRK